MRLESFTSVLVGAAFAGSHAFLCSAFTPLSVRSRSASRPRLDGGRFMGGSDETAEDGVAADDSFVVEAFEVDEGDSVVESPSDVEDGYSSAQPSLANDADPSSGQPASLDQNLLYLQSLGAITSRGEFASKAQKQSARQVIESVEAANPTPEPTTSPNIRGRWELVYSTTQLFRSSPFFLAGRATCTTPDQAKQYDWFCNMHRQALSISTIGPVRQIVSGATLTHEFSVKAGAVPFLSDLTPFSYSGGLPVGVEGAIVSTADLATVENGTAWELLMDTVEIKGSNLPGVRQVLDAGIKLQSRELGRALENIPALGYSNPRPVFRTTYLDQQFRISRDQDDNAFVYVKTSGDEQPTDFSSVDSDLGIGRLLEGFNDAVTKFYL
jgi:PAP_fibrillin